MLPDAAHIQEKDHETLQRRGKAGPASEPLYTLVDAIAVQDLLVGVPYRRITHLRKHMALVKGVAPEMLPPPPDPSLFRSNPAEAPPATAEVETSSKIQLS